MTPITTLALDKLIARCQSTGQPELQALFILERARKSMTVTEINHRSYGTVSRAQSYLMSQLNPFVLRDGLDLFMEVTN